MKFAALTFMYGDSIGKFQLIQLFKGIGGTSAVKFCNDFLTLPVDRTEVPDVPVENAGAVFAVLVPDDVVVVLDLHHLVALPKGVQDRTTFRLVYGFGVEYRL